MLSDRHMKASFSDDNLMAMLSVGQLPRTAKTLLLLALNEGAPKSQRELRALAKEIGLAETRRWRFADIFEKLRKEVRLTNRGWALTPAGVRQVEGIPALIRDMLSQTDK